MLSHLHLQADEPAIQVHLPHFLEATPNGSSQKKLTQPGSSSWLRNFLHHIPEVSIQVTGSSMFPFIRRGERVTIQGVTPSQALHPGEIILFTNSSGRLLLHRVLKIQDDGRNRLIQTKGDNQRAPDTPITPNMVIARVCGLEKKIPFVKNCCLNLDSWSWRLVGKALVICSRLNFYPNCRSILSVTSYPVKSCLYHLWR